MRAFGLAFAGVLLALSFVSTALAQIRIQTRVSSQQVEVGATLSVEGKAMSEEEAPTQPRLQPPAGVSVRGPSVGTSHSMTIGSGGMVHQRGITATWQLVFPKAGVYTIGPISMLTPAGRVSGETVEIQVVPAGTLPKPQRRRRRSIFDDDFMPGLPGGGRSLFDDLLRDIEPEEPPAPPEFQLDKAPPEAAFLRALATPREVVVGEQVTFRVLAYSRNGRFGLGVGHEARHPDFYAHDLPRPGRPDWHDVVVDGERLKAVEIRAKALFPLKAGELTISPMQMEIRGPRTNVAQQGVNATSEALTIRVVEPPQRGRPPGYELGDVGDYELTVSVTPRTIPAGGSIAVTANLEGTGNVPSHLLTPDQNGVQWLQPTIRSDLRLQGRDRVGGSQTFVYLVKLENPGTVDLGELSLPYYSLKERRYKIARAKLGSIDVQPGPESTDTPKAATKTRTKLSELVALRPVRPSRASVQAPWSEHPGFWFAALAPPVGILLGQYGSARLSSLLRRKRKSEEGPSRLAQRALSDAEKATEPSEVAAELERALFFGVEHATALKARGLLKDELPARLRQAGLSADLADEVVQRLQACEDVRFAGANAPAKELLQACRSTVTQLRKHKPSTAA